MLCASLPIPGQKQDLMLSVPLKYKPEGPSGVDQATECKTLRAAVVHRNCIGHERPGVRPQASKLLRVENPSVKALTLRDIRAPGGLRFTRQGLTDMSHAPSEPEGYVALLAPATATELEKPLAALPSEAGATPPAATVPDQQQPAAVAANLDDVGQASLPPNGHGHTDLQPDVALPQQGNHLAADSSHPVAHGQAGHESNTSAWLEAGGLSQPTTGFVLGASQEQAQPHQPPADDRTNEPVNLPAAQEQASPHECSDSVDVQNAAYLPAGFGLRSSIGASEPNKEAVVHDYSPPSHASGLPEAQNMLTGSQPVLTSSQPDLAIQDWPNTSLADHGLMQQQLQQQLQMQMLGAPQFRFIPGGNFSNPMVHAQGPSPTPEQQYISAVPDGNAAGMTHPAGFAIPAADGASPAALHAQPYGTVLAFGEGPQANSMNAGYAAALGFDPGLYHQQPPTAATSLDAAAQNRSGSFGGFLPSSHAVPGPALPGPPTSAGHQSSAELSFNWANSMQQQPLAQQQLGDTSGGMGMKDPRLLLQEAVQDAHPTSSGHGFSSAGSPRNPLKRPASDTALSSDPKRSSARRHKVAKDHVNRRQQQPQQQQPDLSQLLTPHPGAVSAADPTPENHAVHSSQPGSQPGTGVSAASTQRDQLSFLAAIAAQYPSPTVSSAMGVSNGPEAVAMAQAAPIGAEGHPQPAPDQDRLLPANFMPQQLHMQPTGYQAMIPAGGNGLQGPEFLTQAGMIPAHQLSLMQSLQGYPNMDAQASQLLQHLPEASGPHAQQDLQQQQQLLLQQLGQFPGGIQPLQADGYPLQQLLQGQQSEAAGPAVNVHSPLPDIAPEGAPTAVISTSEAPTSEAPTSGAPTSGTPTGGDAVAAAEPSAAAADAGPAEEEEEDQPQGGKKGSKKSRQGRSSIYKGVLKGRGPDRWEAQIRAWGKAVHLGTYPDQDEAARAYDKATICLG
ncbi:hypothetical protein WJX74_007938, partial [Apatococcus lobatus]